MTNFWGAINAIRREATKLRTDPYSAGCFTAQEAATDMDVAANVLEAAAQLTFEDKTWLANRVDLAIAEYTPIIDGMTCPGRARKDRFRALLTALPEPEKEADNG